jgi:hypothetical protein
MLDIAHCMTYIWYSITGFDSSPLSGLLGCHYSQLADFVGGIFKISGNSYNLKQKHLNIQWPGSNPDPFINEKVPGSGPATVMTSKTK